MRHGGAPIEDILAFPSGGVGVTVGGPILRVWDLNMGRCVRALSNHQKTVTCAAFDGTKGRVLTGGLDAMVKVYDVEEWKVVHSMRYPSPVLSLAVSVSVSPSSGSNGEWESCPGVDKWYAGGTREQSTTGQRD